MSVMISHKTMFGSSLPPVVFMRIHVLIAFIVFACVYWCPTHFVLYFCFVFLRLVYSMLPGSLDCPFLIVPSVFSNIFLEHPKKQAITTLIKIFPLFYRSRGNIHACFAHNDDGG
jgi:hypothetical protein